MSILRTWGCLNKHCGQEFEAWEENPICPSCEGVRVNWVPRGGHVQGIARGADAELRALADCFKMDNMHSPSRDEHAKPRVAQKPVDPKAPVHDFGGFAARIDPTMGAQCVPTANNISFKTSAGIGQKLTGQLGMPSVQSATQIEGAHRK